jgi:hypothetical protein
VCAFMLTRARALPEWSTGVVVGHRDGRAEPAVTDSWTLEWPTSDDVPPRDRPTGIGSHVVITPWTAGRVTGR